MHDPGFEWFRFYSGQDRALSKTVCRVPTDAQQWLGTTTSLLHIGLNYVRKSVHKHNMRFDHFPMIELAVRFGAVYTNRDGLAFYYGDGVVFSSIFFVVVKASATRDELWVKTFHRKSAREVRRLQRKQRLLREHRY